jgi:hypothetical protein
MRPRCPAGRSARGASATGFSLTAYGHTPAERVGSISGWVAPLIGDRGSCRFAGATCVLAHCLKWSRAGRVGSQMEIIGRDASAAPG